jgi:Flp pilus assembly protein TadG
VNGNPAKNSHDQSGSALIEFALSFFLIFGVVSGIFQFGYSFYVYNTLVNAVRGGARYASVKPYDSRTTTPTSGFLNSVRKMVVYGDPNAPDGTAPVVAGLDTSKVVLTVTGGGSGSLTAPTQMTVSISGFTVNAVFGIMNLAGKPRATFPYTGILTPI